MRRYLRGVNLPISTPALLFPAISLLFLSYTNRFLHLSSLIRQLHHDWLKDRDSLLLAQISNLRRRLVLIRWMQFLGALCLFFCVTAMLAIIFGWPKVAMGAFVTALLFMAASLTGLILEVWISGGALRIMLKTLEDGQSDQKMNSLNE